ncbi:MAG: hypothetical protein EBW96_05385, partial [Actinobacteria bacterium]|nr:hypothetical protein [Actinomycetota bacterium]
MSETKTSPFAQTSDAQKTSPLAAESPRDTIISVTVAALAKLKELRDTEPDAAKLGLRLSIVSQPGEDF